MLTRMSARMLVVSVAVLLFGSLGLAQESTYDIVKKRGKLIAGVKYDFPPCTWLDKEGKVVGFEMDIVKYIANRMGVGLDTVQITSQTRIPMLLNKNVDLIIHLNPTKKRAEVIDFSIVFAQAGQGIMVRKDSGIKGIDDLKKPRKTATVSGSEDGPGFLAGQPKGELVFFQEHTLGVLALKKGTVDAVTTSAPILLTFVKEEPTLIVLPQMVRPDPWSIGVRQNDSKWRLFLDMCIMDMWADGSIKKMFQKYDFSGQPLYKIPVWTDYYLDPAIRGHLD